VLIALDRKIGSGNEDPLAVELERTLQYYAQFLARRRINRVLNILPVDVYIVLADHIDGRRTRWYCEEYDNERYGYSYPNNSLVHLEPSRNETYRIGSPAILGPCGESLEASRRKRGPVALRL
jgi:hypothetical protein